MSPITKQITDMIDMLPEPEQNLAFEVIKRMVLAWDPDYTKVTSAEAADMEQAQKDYECGEAVRHEDINWE